MQQQNVSKILFNLPFVLLINGFPPYDMKGLLFFLMKTLLDKLLKVSHTTLEMWLIIKLIDSIWKGTECKKISVYIKDLFGKKDTKA